PAGRTGTAGGRGRSRRRDRRVSYVRQEPAGRQTPCVTQQATPAQKEPGGQSALLVHGVLVVQVCPVPSRQRLAPSVVAKHLHPGFVALQGPPLPLQASPLHVALATQEPPTHASPALQQTPLQQA